MAPRSSERTTRYPASKATGDRPSPAGHALRNPGLPLDLDWVRTVRVNRSAVERRTDTLGSRRSVKKDWQAAWLLRAVHLMDLTTLAGDDTPGRVRRLAAKARSPVRSEILDALGVRHLGVRVAGLCVYHAMIEPALQALEGSGIPVVAVSTGFPAGLSPFQQRLEEIHASVAAGASEIDVVITRANVLTGNWTGLYDEVQAFRAACGSAHLKSAHLKTIIATGELATLSNVARASLVCMMAGADFVKTSTGKESVNATLPVGLTMIRTIRAYKERSGYDVGFKAAGGIRTAKQALLWMALLKEELGRRWLEPDLFRFGASSLLADIERQLEHHVTGRYSAFHRHPLA